MAFSEKAQESLDKVVKRFEDGDLSPIREIALLKRSAEVPFDRWSFSNRVIAFFQSDSLDLRGYRQWEEVNRTVKKGAKASYILAPIMAKVGDEYDEESGETVPIKRCVNFKAIPVLKYDDTDGEEVDYGYSKIEPPPLLNVAEKFGIEINYQELIGAYGSANLDTGNIRLATDDEAIFFHELAHSIRVKSGLIGTGLTKEQYAREEVIAQFTATVLADIYGMDISGESWKYIAHYVDNPLPFIANVLSDVDKVLQEIGKVESLVPVTL